MNVSITSFGEQSSTPVPAADPPSYAYGRQLQSVCAGHKAVHVKALNMNDIHVALCGIYDSNYRLMAGYLARNLEFFARKKHNSIVAAVISENILVWFEFFKANHLKDSPIISDVLNNIHRPLMVLPFPIPARMHHEMCISCLKMSHVPADNGRHDGYTSQNTRGCVYPFSHILPLVCCVGRVLVHFQSTSHKGNSSLCGGSHE